SFQARGFLRPLKDQDISKFHLDLALIEIAEILYSTYQEFTDKPGTDLYSSSKYPTSLSLPRQALDWPTFVNKFKCTDKLEEQFDSMNPAAYVTMNATIPKGTAIEVSCNKNYSRSLTFKNKFSAINIQIYQSHGRIGTGEWQWLFDYDTKQNEEFWSSTMSIHLSAKFEKLLSGNPDMPLYIEWAESIFENIQTNLDSKQQIDLARDKHHLYKSKIDSFLKENKQSNNTTGKQKVTPVKVEGRSK
ncbi:MAG: hypothetical protein KAR20_29140, partial [Candidatus Heimdallarchaeota archaeon]|nr:hypothetical protein [Candidatus Heimdallarchaeota archaeon]